MAFDAHKNLAVSAVATAPTPATSGTTLTVTAGEGARFPAPPFNATVWPVNAMPTPLTGEVIRVTGRTTDTLTITRAQEGSTARAIGSGDLIAATITAKTLTDLETRAALKDEPNIFTVDQELAANVIRLGFRDLGAPSNARLFRWMNFGQEMALFALDDAATTVQATPIAARRSGDVAIGRNLLERGRVTPMGQMTGWPAALTTAEGAACGGTVFANFCLIGQALFYQVLAVSFTVPASTAVLRLSLPAGYPSATGFQQAFAHNFVGGVGTEMGYANVADPHLQVYRGNAAAWPPAGGELYTSGFYFTTG